MCELQPRFFDSEEAERRRLAQELHDGPLQELHSLDFGLVAISGRLKDRQESAHLSEMRSTLRKVSRQLRSVCQELRPPALAPFGASAAIRSCADRFQETFPELEIELNLAEDGQRLPERIRLVLFRICQQGLRNIGQHAAAQYVRMSLQLSGDEVTLGIEDDGRGFTLPHEWDELARAGKFGLIGCIERAEAIGGHVEILSSPGCGAQIRVTAPLTAESHDAGSVTG